MKTRLLLSTPFLPSRYWPSPHVLALCLFGLAGMADGALMPFFALWAQRAAHVSVSSIGLLLACYAGGELLATPFLGGIADQWGRRPVLLLSSLGVGLGFLVLAHLHGTWWIALCLLGIGIFECAFHPTIATVVADTVPANQLRMRYAATHTASGVGHVIGPALGAALALLSLNAVFIGCGVALLCASLLIVSMLPETRSDFDAQTGNAEEEYDGEEGLSALLPAFRDPRLAIILLWFALIEVVTSWPEVVTPPYAHGGHALSASGVGLLFTYGAAIGALLQWPVARFTRTLATFPLLVTAALAIAGGFALLMVHPQVITLYASVTLLALAQVLFDPLIPVTVNALAPRASRASYMAAISTVNDIKDAAGPASGMYLYGVWPRLPWILGLPIAVMAALGLAVSIRRSEPVQENEAIGDC